MRRACSHCRSDWSRCSNGPVDRPACAPALRGARHRRQGRHDPAHARAHPTRASLATSRFPPQRDRGRAVVLPAVRRAAPRTHGEITFFDRSWYNRAGVERVMRFASAAQVRDSSSRSCRSSGSSSTTASISSRSGCRSDARSRPNGSTRDAATRSNGGSSARSTGRPPRVGRTTPYATLEVFRRTDTPQTPWWFVNNNNKRVGRLNVVQHVLNLLPYDSKDEPQWAGPARHRGAGTCTPPHDRTGPVTPIPVELHSGAATDPTGRLASGEAGDDGAEEGDDRGAVGRFAQPGAHDHQVEGGRPPGYWPSWPLAKKSPSRGGEHPPVGAVAPPLVVDVGQGGAGVVDPASGRICRPSQIPSRR